MLWTSKDRIAKASELWKRSLRSSPFGLVSLLSSSMSTIVLSDREGDQAELGLDSYATSRKSIQEIDAGLAHIIQEILVGNLMNRPTPSTYVRLLATYLPCGNLSPSVLLPFSYMHTSTCGRYLSILCQAEHSRSER